DRTKSNKRRNKNKKEKARRDCDKQWQECMSASVAGWRSARIQPGAPLPIRITNIVTGLTKVDFKAYVAPDQEPNQRTLIECFPNEVIWSAGVLGFCGNYTYASMVAYKQMGKSKTILPSEILKAVFSHTVRPCLKVAGMPDDWHDACWERLSKVAAVKNEGSTGKAFDDAIDSLLCLVASSAFAIGNAHVHQKRTSDGHIIGPGMPKPEVV
ncbi:MAG: hypothetical protein KDA42_12360, partial [Planctomycetales bacterium]|nr:hypothetical protein [Planctomycetales bacterium]